MIVARIWGGLGNQMFQYAMGYAIARDHNTNLKLDTTFFTKKNTSRQTFRTLDIYRLPIECKDEITSLTDVGLLLPLLHNPYINFAIRKILPLSFRIGKFTYIKEDKLEYLPNAILPSRDNLYYDGYWHSDKYFIKYKDDLVRQFVYTNDAIEDCYNGLLKESDGEPVAVHIRRGDYVTQNNPNVMGVDYYRKAINEMREYVKNPIFCFFSDDLDWVSEQFKDIAPVLVNKDRKLNDIDEFQLMAKCKHQIISNSSFSWWAAWLNQNPNKTVIVPKVWKNKKDMMRDEWIKL